MSYLQPIAFTTLVFATYLVGKSTITYVTFNKCVYFVKINGIDVQQLNYAAPLSQP